MGIGGQRHAPDALPRAKTRYPLYRRLTEPQGWSGRVQKTSPPSGFDPRTVQTVASRYTDCWLRKSHKLISVIWGSKEGDYKESSITTPYSLVDVNLRSGEMCCFSLQRITATKMVATACSKTSVYTYTHPNTCRNTTESSDLYQIVCPYVEAGERLFQILLQFLSRSMWHVLLPHIPACSLITLKCIKNESYCHFYELQRAYEPFSSP